MDVWRVLAEDGRVLAAFERKAEAEAEAEHQVAAHDRAVTIESGPAVLPEEEA